MDHAILPLEIITDHIAVLRPGALWAFLSTCKVVYTTIKPNLEHLQNSWLRKIEQQKKSIYHSHTMLILTRWDNPNGSYHGEFKIVENYYNNINPVFCGNFKNGVPHGRFIKYNHNIDKILDANYVDGKLHGIYESKEWYRGDPYTVTINYVHGKKHGKYVKRCYNHVIYECNFIMDVKEGTEQEFYDDGSKKTTCQYIKGRIHGWRYAYDNTGYIECATLYNMGEEVVAFDGDIGRMLID
jgi:antitoxin component YwqK of YwqJK toxin-antitoxin module